MNLIKQFIADRLGLVMPEELEKVKAGLPQGQRPLQRSDSIIGQDIAPDMKFEEYLKAYKGWVFACVSVLAQETADIELTLYERRSQNDFKIVDSHPVLDLLYKVNPIYTSYLLWEATIAYLKLVGECYWWLVGPRDNPKEIWVLRPDWVVIKDSKGRLIDHYLYGPDSAKRIKIPYEEVIPFKDFNPTNAFRGFGVVKAAAKTIDEDEFQKDYSRNFFYNSAMPAGALETDKNLNPDQYKRMRDDWESVHRGTKKAWKVAILEAGLKWQDIGMNRKDMDFIEGRKLTRDETMAMFRVPKALLTFDDVNRAAAKEARAILLENVVSHDMKRLVTFLNEFLLPRYGNEALFFGFKDPVPNDKLMEMNYYKAALGGAPWMTQNEVREENDLEPVEGGDKLGYPFSLADQGAERTSEQQERALRKRQFNFRFRIPQYPYLKRQSELIHKSLEEKVEKMLRSLVQKKKEQSELIHNLSTKEAQEAEVVVESFRDGAWKTLLTRTNTREARYKNSLNELFTTQEQEVKSRVDNILFRTIKTAKGQGVVLNTKANVSEVADVTGDQTVFVETLMELVRTFIESEGIEQIQALSEGAVFYMQTTEIQKYLKSEGGKFIASINEETTEQLRDTLSEAIKNQESIQQIKQRVEDVYEDARGYRAERIARSEVLRATNFATEQAYIQSKRVEAKEWLTAKDERTCPWCGPMDGKRLGLGQAYFEEGDQVKGINEAGKSVYLTVGIADVSAPPLHPNCRCTLVPVLLEE